MNDMTAMPEPGQRRQPTDAADTLNYHTSTHGEFSLHLWLFQWGRRLIKYMWKLERIISGTFYVLAAKSSPHLASSRTFLVILLRMKDGLKLNWFSLCILRFFFSSACYPFLKIIIFQISSKLLIRLFVGSALFLDLPSLRHAMSGGLGPDERKRVTCGLLRA